MVSKASRKAEGCEQSYRKDGSWERRHTCSEGWKPEEVEEDVPGRVEWEQAMKGSECHYICSPGFPLSGFKFLQLPLAVVTFSTILYLRFSCDTCLAFQAPNLHHSSHNFFPSTGLVTFSLPRMPEILLHLSHHVSALYIKI